MTRVGVGLMAPDRAQPDLSRVHGVRIHPTEPWAGRDRAVLCAGMRAEHFLGDGTVGLS